MEWEGSCKILRSPLVTVHVISPPGPCTSTGVKIPTLGVKDVRRLSQKGSSREDYPLFSIRSPINDKEMCGDQDDLFIGYIGPRYKDPFFFFFGISENLGPVLTILVFLGLVGFVTSTGFRERTIRTISGKT